MNSSAIPYERLGIGRLILVALFLCVGLGYLVWRYQTLGQQSLLFSWLLYLAEIYGYLTAALHLFMTARLTVRTPPEPARGYSVDVLIPTYNEDVELVRKTVLAAVNMDYPHITWLLDDGDRAEMRRMAEDLGIRYLTRAENSHAKAGNLNNALQHCTGELIALFDADHAPQRRFLLRTIGYFNDADVAFVQTPQEFFNLDSYQHRLKIKGKRLWTEQSLFFKVIQRGKDYWNAAFFCGCSAVIRRSALDRIGGFATETITEDLHTSLKLHKAGYKSVYHDESLAFGIAPGNIAPFLKQRVRWGQGAMQVLRSENIFFTRKLSLAQKLNYLASTMTYFDGWQKGIFYIGPAFVLITGILPIEADGMTFLAYFLPYYLLSMLVFEEMSRGYGKTFYIEQYNFARFAAFAWATLGLFRRNLKFAVTDKGMTKSQESTRLFLPQFVILVFNTLAIPIGIFATNRHSGLPTDAFVFNTLWATVNLIIGITAFGFTKKIEHHLRNEYRFPIPLPLYVDADDGKRQMLTIDNISSNGLRIYGNLPKAVTIGAIICGRIQLPALEIPIRAQVSSFEIGRSERGDFVKAVGCKLVWENQREHDSLDTFLYGSDLQWRLLELEEKSPTPFDWISTIGKKRQVLLQRDENWATCEVVSFSNEVKMAGLVPMARWQATPDRILTFTNINPGAPIVLILHTRTARRKLHLIALSSRCIELSSGNIYVSEVTAVSDSENKTHEQTHLHQDGQSGPVVSAPAEFGGRALSGRLGAFSPQQLQLPWQHWNDRCANPAERSGLSPVGRSRDLPVPERFDEPPRQRRRP